MTNWRWYLDAQVHLTRLAITSKEALREANYFGRIFVELSLATNGDGKLTSHQLQGNTRLVVIARGGAFWIPLQDLRLNSWG